MVLHADARQRVVAESLEVADCEAAFCADATTFDELFGTAVAQRCCMFPLEGSHTVDCSGSFVGEEGDCNSGTVDEGCFVALRAS